MFYAAFTNRREDTPTVWDGTNRPVNFTVKAFDTQAERQAAIDAKWESGGNGFKKTRKAVAGYYGTGFVVVNDGTVMSESDALYND